MCGSLLSYKRHINFQRERMSTQIAFWYFFEIILVRNDKLSLLHPFSLIFSVQQNILQISRPFLLPHEAILYDDYENV